jgi:hypothetical protein
LPCFGNVTYLKHWMSGIVTRHYGLVVSVLLHYWEVGFKSSMETILYYDHFFSVCRQILWSHFHIYVYVCLGHLTVIISHSYRPLILFVHSLCM